MKILILIGFLNLFSFHAFGQGVDGTLSRCAGVGCDDGPNPWGESNDDINSGSGGDLAPGEGGPTMGGPLGEALGGLSEPVKDFFKGFDAKHRREKKKRQERSRLRSSISSTAELIDSYIASSEAVYSSSLANIPSAEEINFLDLEIDSISLDETVFRGVESDASMPEFETSVVSWSGERVRSAFDTVRKNEGRAMDVGAASYSTYAEAAHQAIIEADKLYISGDTEQADFNIEFAKQLSGAGTALSKYHGEGKLWYQAIHSANPNGSLISYETRAASTYDLSRKILAGGALQSHSMHQTAKNLGAKPNPFTPRIIQGGGEAIKVANVWSRLGPLMSAAGRVLNIGLTALSLGGDTRLDENGFPVTPAYHIGTISAEEMNDSRITHRSPQPGDSPARWHQYLTGTGIYDSQQGLIDEDDSELAMGLLESGFRDPKQIEGIVESAKDFGVPKSKIGDFAKSASTSGMWASGRKVGTEPATLLKSGKLDAKDISDIIPEGAPNTWNPSSGTSFEKGFKYEWSHNGTKYHVHGHTTDPTAPVGSNAANGWTVRVRIGNRWLKTDGTTTRNTTLYGNETHIPFKPIME